MVKTTVFQRYISFFSFWFILLSFHHVFHKLNTVIIVLVHFCPKVFACENLP